MKNAPTSKASQSVQTRANFNTFKAALLDNAPELLLLLQFAAAAVIVGGCFRG